MGVGVVIEDGHSNQLTHKLLNRGEKKNSGYLMLRQGFCSLIYLFTCIRGSLFYSNSLKCPPFFFAKRLFSSPAMLVNILLPSCFSLLLRRRRSPLLPASSQHQFLKLKALIISCGLSVFLFALLYCFYKAVL